MRSESADSRTSTELHGGHIIARRLRASGVTTLFTLSGAHLFPLYDGCRAEGIRIVDVRHEQTAAFAAEGWFKSTRELGVCAVTAGPGVTNSMSALGAASSARSPMLVIGGRAPQWRWGQGSLQEIDHVPFVAPLVRHAATSRSTDDLSQQVDDAIEAAWSSPGGPAFLDVPLDHMFGQSSRTGSSVSGPTGRVPAATEPVVDEQALSRAVAAIAASRRPVVMAGSGLYAARAEAYLLQLIDSLGAAALVNGLGRGCVPTGHPQLVARARSAALRDADLVVLVGTPIDFRLGFGEVFAADATVISVDVHPATTRPARPADIELVGPVAATLADLVAAADGRRAETSWLAGLQQIEVERRRGEDVDRTDLRSPLHPVHMLDVLIDVLEDDAIVVGDGGDVVSWAGRMVPTSLPGGFLDPGPFGCLGSGPGYALAAALAHPNRRVCLVLGDGAFGFAGMELDTFVRHGVPVVCVVGNNGIWGLEKHPMQMLYGYDVAADLQSGCRYDLVAEALGCHGELVDEPSALRPALERAFASGRPALVNVLTDPSLAYPRSTNLA